MAKKPLTPAPDDLTREQLIALSTWIKSRPHFGRLGSDRKKKRLLVDACLAHHRAKGNEFVDWYAVCQKWISIEFKFEHERYTSEKPKMSEPRGRDFTPLSDFLEGFGKGE